MNKYDGALKFLNYCNQTLIPDNTEVKSLFALAIRDLQELVDKSTTKPLIEKWAWHCQSCGQGFVNHGGNKDNYCSNCGQRLTEEI